MDLNYNSKMKRDLEKLSNENENFYNLGFTNHGKIES